MKIKGIGSSGPPPDTSSARPPPPGSSRVVFRFPRNPREPTLIDVDGRTYQRVFSEDEVLRHDPDATKVNGACRAFLGQAFDLSLPGDCLDEGECQVEVWKTQAGPPLDRFVIVHGVEGSSLWLPPDAIPAYVVFGEEARFTFEAIAALARVFEHDEVTRLRETAETRDPVGDAMIRLALELRGLGGFVQNTGPLTSDDMQSMASQANRVEQALVSFQDKLREQMQRIVRRALNTPRKMA